MINSIKWSNAVSKIKARKYPLDLSSSHWGSQPSNCSRKMRVISDCAVYGIQPYSPFDYFLFSKSTTHFLDCCSLCWVTWRQNRSPKYAWSAHPPICMGFPLHTQVAWNAISQGIKSYFWSWCQWTRWHKLHSRSKGELSSCRVNPDKWEMGDEWGKQMHFFSFSSSTDYFKVVILLCGRDREPC